MKKLSVRLPKSLVAELEAEARARGVSKSAIVREHIQHERIGKLPPQLVRASDHRRHQGNGGVAAVVPAVQRIDTTSTGG